MARLSRNRNHPSVRALAVLTLAALTPALVASGCGGSNAKEASASNIPEEFGLTLAQLAARVEDTEARIAACMAAAGFGYVALDFPALKKAMDSDQSKPGLSDDAYLKQFGHGITTQFDKPLVTFGAGPQNNARLAGLPAAEQVAYRRALWGEAPEWNHARALEEEDFSQTAGCTRRAAEQTYQSDELAGTYVNPADKAVEQDPRMIAALRKWADCVGAQGYPFDHPDQIDEDLRQRLAAIAQGQDPATLTGPALAALNALQGEERAVAAVAKRCEEDHLEAVQAKVEAELYGGTPT